MTIRVRGQQQRARDTRTLILQTAKTLFLARGFDAVSIEEIAKTAGLGKGTVLAHFSEKLNILAVFLAETIDQCVETVANLQQPFFPDRLARALLPLIERLLSDHAYLRLMVSDRVVALELINPSLTQLKFQLSKGLAMSRVTHSSIATELVLASVFDVAIVAFREKALAPDAEVDIGRAIVNRLSFILRDSL